MRALEELIDIYCGGWSAPDPAERERLIHESLASDATYCDPRADNLTVSALLDHIAKIQETRPGARVVRSSAVDTHHNVARFHWYVILADGSRLPEGIDIVEITADGQKIQRILGFFGPLRPREIGGAA